MNPFNIIVAMDAQNGIGKNGELPWYIPEDMRHFKEVTTKCRSDARQNAVIMGRKTWDSIPEKFRPLVRRKNLVITRNRDLDLPQDVIRASSFDAALEQSRAQECEKEVENVFVIGGAQIYQQALNHAQCQKIYLTLIEAVFDCDTFFPPFKEQFTQTSSTPVYRSRSIPFRFLEYARIKSDI